MKILFIVNGYSSTTEALSGGEVHCRMLIDFINKKKHSVVVCSDKYYRDIKQIKNVEKIVYPSLPFEHKFYNFFPILFFIYLYRSIATVFITRKIDVDYIITNSHFFYDIIPIYFIRKTKNLILFTYLHHIVGEQKRKGIAFPIINFLEQISFNIIKRFNIRVFADSADIKKCLVERYNFNSSNVYITRNGVDLNLINRVSYSGKKFDLIFIGRLNVTKGIYDLVEIVKRVKLSIPNIKCAVVGDGIELNNLKSLIRKEELMGNIKLFGFVSEVNKINLLKSSKIFLLPSHEEGWGIVIGEALACGVPALVYRLHDIEKIWNDNVLWINCFDIDQFSNMIVHVLTNKNEFKKYQHNGQIFAKKLNWNDILNKESHILGLN